MNEGDTLNVNDAFRELEKALYAAFAGSEFGRVVVRKGRDEFPVLAHVSWEVGGAAGCNVSVTIAEDDLDAEAIDIHAKAALGEMRDGVAGDLKLARAVDYAQRARVASA